MAAKGAESPRDQGRRHSTKHDGPGGDHGKKEGFEEEEQPPLTRVKKDFKQEKENFLERKADDLDVENRGRG
ncbi:hypothetical protein VNO77_30813 [Canavalia gladiata]|uniref:Uncharacterized protein n=1 Tax=Canavalia gladiata TaxID=3824 RepID=A0AAN9KP60_CANGL